MRETLLFARRALSDFHATGALVPSSRALGRALADGIEAIPPPRRVLEVGGGTGAVTREILDRLEAGDLLVVYEIDRALAAHLGETPAVRRSSARVEIRAADIRAMPPPPPDERYHAAIASLPFQNLAPEATSEVWKTILCALAPGGWASFYRYALFPALRAALPTEAGRRTRAARAALDAITDGRVVSRRWVLANVPPAWAIRVMLAP
jgi:phospholipid N-methyltransferase